MASAAAIATALRSRLPDHVGVTRVHKLLYYCQGWHATWTGERLFPEAIEAWAMGPVVVDLWISEKRSRGVLNDFTPLGDLEKRTVEYVVARYGGLSASALVRQTHEEAPWSDAWTRARNSEVEVGSMAKCFAEDPAADQAWFWDEEWQSGEREVDDDIARGRTSGPLSAEEFLTNL